MHAEKPTTPLRVRIASLSENVETPIDLDRVKVNSSPLLSDSTSMDVQYFSFDDNNRDGSTFAFTVSAYIAASTSSLGTQISARLSAASAATLEQILYQTSKKDNVGTLVFAASYRHKNSLVLDPLILDVDKGIHAHNHVIRNARLDPTNRKEMIAIAARDERDERETFRIMSGMTFVSSFVGMVHVLSSTSINAAQGLRASASTLQAQVDAGDLLGGAADGSRVNAASSPK